MAITIYVKSFGDREVNCHSLNTRATFTPKEHTYSYSKRFILVCLGYRMNYLGLPHCQTDLSTNLTCICCISSVKIVLKLETHTLILF